MNGTFLDVGRHRFDVDALSNFKRTPQSEEEEANETSSSSSSTPLYPILTILLFAEHVKEPHNSYVKAVEKSHPGLGTVDRRDRISLKLFFEEGIEII